jgi:hypothetical protein
MLDISAQDLRHTAIQFLEQNPSERLQILNQLGIARYDFGSSVTFMEIVQNN